MANKVADSISREEYFYGHKACAGCGGSLAVRAALKVLGQNAVSVLPRRLYVSGGLQFPAALLLQQLDNFDLCGDGFDAHGR